MAVIETFRKKGGKDVATGTKIMICGKEVKLKFTMPIWLQMEDEVCLMDDLYTMMHSKGRFEEDKIPKLVELMAGGAVTAREVLDGSDPVTMRYLLDEIQRVIAKAVTMKEKKYEDDSVHDEVLEDIEKKEQQAE